MFKHKNFVIIILSLFYFLSSVSFSDIKIIVKPGWNLISIPYDSSYKVSEIFPTAISKAYYYDNRYMICDTLVGGLGYWLKFPVFDSISIAGGGNIYDTVKVNEGWNMIGSVHKIIPKHLITTQPEGIILSHYYKYNPAVGYEIADTVKPGEGYWVKCSSPGTIIFTLRPKLISPVNNSSNQPRAISFKWQSLIYANYYHIQVSTDSMFSNIILEDSALSRISKNLCNLEYASYYYWRVRGNSDNVWGKWSEIWQFKTLLQPEPISDVYALYTFKFENGLRILDPNNFQLLDSLQAYYVSSNFEFSPGDSIWYFVSRMTDEGVDSLFAVDAITKNVLFRRESYSNRWILDKDKRYLINQAYDTLTIIDRLTFQLVHKEPIKLGRSISSPIKSELYCFINRGIAVYNIDSFRVERNITIEDSLATRWSPRDLNISSDGRYLYLTVRTRGGTSYEGTFYVIDLLTDSVISKHPCARTAYIGVSPDNNFVYLSDALPLIITDEYPIGEVLRYNVNTRIIEIYIKWNNFAGYTSNWFMGTQRVIVSPDSRYIYILRSGVGQLCNGQTVNLLKIDVDSKDIVEATYVEGLFGIKFGKYIK